MDFSKHHQYYHQRMIENRICYFVTPRNIGISTMQKFFLVEYCIKNSDKLCVYMSPYATQSAFYTKGLLDLINNKFVGVNSIKKLYKSSIYFKNDSRIIISEKFSLLEGGDFDMIVVDNFAYMGNINRRFNTLEYLSHKNFEKLIISNDNSRNDSTIINLNRIFGADNVHYNVKTLDQLLNFNKLYRKEKLEMIFKED